MTQPNQENSSTANMQIQPQNRDNSVGFFQQKQPAELNATKIVAADNKVRADIQAKVDPQLASHNQATDESKNGHIVENKGNGNVRIKEVHLTCTML